MGRRCALLPVQHEDWVRIWSDWEGDATKTNWEGYGDFNDDSRTLGMLLDLDNHTLSVYQNGRRLGTLKDGLAGEYCWIAGTGRDKGDLSIQRGSKREHCVTLHT